MKGVFFFEGIKLYVKGIKLLYGSPDATKKNKFLMQNIAGNS